MRQKEILFGTIGFLSGIVITVIFVNNSSFSGNMRMENRGLNNSGDSTQNSSVQGNVMDSHFIEQMIPHHEDAIVMAELALKKSAREEIKNLSQNIIDSQSLEINQMKEWYKEWFGREVESGNQVMSQHGMMSNSGMHMGMMGGNHDVEALENSSDFDSEFIEQMIPHHQMAVMMANMLKNGTTRPEMRELADDIIAAQTREIDQMRKWYIDWGY